MNNYIQKFNERAENILLMKQESVILQNDKWNKKHWKGQGEHLKFNPKG